MNKEKIPRLEIILVIIGFLVLGYELTFIQLREAHTDTLWYMNMSLNNIADAHWQNRYTHVFLQKIFLELFRDPFVGLKYFWIFSVTTTSALIYLSTRIVAKRSNFIHAGLAVAIFLSHHLIGEKVGVVLIDNTATLIVMVSVTLYLYSVRCNHTKRWIIIALGFVFFLAFKTKETTWFLGILLLGLGFNDTNRFNIAFFKKNLINVFFGLLAGFLLFLLLHGVLLGDFLFGLSLSQVQEYSSPFETEPTRIFQEAESWYDSLILVFFPVPFILYLISGLKQQGKFLLALKLFWALPLMAIILLTGSMLTGPFGGISRLMLPGYALISVFAPLAIDFSFPESPKKETAKFLGSLVIGMIFLYVLRITARNLTNSAGIEYDDFLRSIINPIFFTVLLGILITFEKFTPRTVIIPLVSLIALVSTPVLENYQQIKDTSNVLFVQRRFYPFYEFGEYIAYDEEMLMYVSPHIPAELGFFSNDIGTLYTLFDLYFGEKTSPGNFTYSPAPEDVLDHILAGQYDYVFLTEIDWTNLDPSVDPTLQIATVCDIFHDMNQPIVFLTCN